MHARAQSRTAQFLAFIPALHASTLVAAAATLYVSPTGSNTPPYTNWATAARAIQTGVNAAANGDTVRVAPATYSLTAPVIVDRGVTLVGDTGAASTILHGSGTTNCIRMAHTGAVLRGFTVRNGRAYDGGGVYLAKYGVVEECTLSNNVASHYGGGICADYIDTLEDCLMAGNWTAGNGGGACIYQTPMWNLTVVDNEAEQSCGGIYRTPSGTGGFYRLEVRRAN